MRRNPFVVFGRRSLRGGVTCLWLLILLLPPLFAAQAETGSFYHSRWALLIGVGQFQNPNIPSLRFCDNDVKAVRELLIDRCGFAPDHIVTLVNSQATKANIVQEMSRLSDQKVVSDQDAVLVYFSGHGQTVPLPRGGEMGFLIPYDAKIDLSDLTNPAAYYATCVGMDELRRLADLIPAKHVLFLLDACYSGLAIETRRSVIGDRALADVAGRPVREIIVAGLRDEPAYEKPDWQHGAFTYALLKGIESGACDFNRDSVVTGLELAAYLRDAVPRLSPQTPQYAAFGGDGEFLLECHATAPDEETVQKGPRIVLTDPPDAGGITEEIPVRPVGDTISLGGVLLGPQPAQSLTINKVTVPLTRANIKDLESIPRGSDDRVAMRFQGTVRIGLGEIKTVRLLARDPAGRETSRLLRFRAIAADSSPPEIRVAEVRSFKRSGNEVDSTGILASSTGIHADDKGILASSKGIIAVSKSVAVVPIAGQTVSVFGFARDDRAVVSVAVNGTPVPTKPATPEQLEGLGWTSGVSFEGKVVPQRDKPTDVVVTATDAAGNEGVVTLSVNAEAGTGPDLLIIEPTQSRELRGTGLLLPKEKSTIKVRGLARSDSTIVRVQVGNTPATLRPATAKDVEGSHWPLPAVCFEAEVNIAAATGTPLLPESDRGTYIPIRALGAAAAHTDLLAVVAVDAKGRKTTRSILVRRQQPPLHAILASDKEEYRVGDRIHFRISANRDAYVYVFHRESDGTLSVFLPNPVEPDTRIIGNTTRTFPDPSEQAKWEGQYGLVAQEPAGMDTVYCLTLPDPLPAALLDSLASLPDLGHALETSGRARGTKMILPSAIDTATVAALATQLGGTWQELKYEVKR